VTVLLDWIHVISWWLSCHKERRKVCCKPSRLFEALIHQADVWCHLWRIHRSGVARVRETEIFLDQSGNIVKGDKKKLEKPSTLKLRIRIISSLGTRQDMQHFSEKGWSWSWWYEVHCWPQASTQDVAFHHQSPVHTFTLSHQWAVSPSSVSSSSRENPLKFHHIGYLELIHEWTLWEEVMEALELMVSSILERINISQVGLPVHTRERWFHVPLRSLREEESAVRSVSASSERSMTWTFSHSTWWPGTCFLIIDGCKSRLDPMFLTYINDDNHVWKVRLGVLYATSYWQVGIQGMLVPRKTKTG